MSEPLVFMMGQFAAEFPTDRLYATNHMWAMPLGENRYRFGFSAYAVRLLQDVYFLDITVEPGTMLKSRQDFGSIESKKAESSLHAPIEGAVVSLNSSLMEDPSAINVEKYGSGWLLEMEGDGSGLLDAPKYLEHLDKAWEVAQRTIKGQVNG